MEKLRAPATTSTKDFSAAPHSLSFFLFFILPSFEPVSIDSSAAQCIDLLTVLLDDESLACTTRSVSVRRPASSLFGAQVACWMTGSEGNEIGVRHTHSCYINGRDEGISDYQTWNGFKIISFGPKRLVKMKSFRSVFFSACAWLSRLTWSTMWVPTRSVPP